MLQLMDMIYKNSLTVLMGLYAFSPIYIGIIGSFLDSSSSDIRWAVYPYGIIFTVPIAVVLIGITLILIRPHSSNLEVKAVGMAILLLSVIFYTYSHLL
jgi:hypothetical protein